MATRPFTIDVSDEVLADLHRRVAETRFIDDSPGRPPSGMTAAYLRELVASWRDRDGRARERWLNAHPQFLAEVDGTTVHFAHLRTERDDAPALLVMHGWPIRSRCSWNSPTCSPTSMSWSPASPGSRSRRPRPLPSRKRRWHSS